MRAPTAGRGRSTTPGSSLSARRRSELRQSRAASQSESHRPAPGERERRLPRSCDRRRRKESGAIKQRRKRTLLRAQWGACGRQNVGPLLRQRAATNTSFIIPSATCGGASWSHSRIKTESVCLTLSATLRVNYTVASEASNNKSLVSIIQRAWVRPLQDWDWNGARTNAIRACVWSACHAWNKGLRSIMR